MWEKLGELSLKFKQMKQHAKNAINVHHKKMSDIVFFSVANK